MRVQAAAYVAAHAQHRSDSKLFDAAVPYHQRYCVQPACKRRRLTDSTAHVMLHCPAHAAPRRDMAVSVDAAMVAAAGPGHNPLLAAASLAALGNDALRLQVLLGSPPPGSISPVSSGYTTVLKASADFIRTIYNTRWPR